MDEPVPFPRPPEPNGDERPGPAGGRVAILMRTRDRPVLLARALASVLAQTDPDWLLVLVNDGGDPAPVDALVSRHATGFDGRITVLHHPAGLGRQAAANAALALAARQGSFGFVALHDDDDSWHPLFLALTTAWLGRPEHASFAAVLTHWTNVHERLDGAGVIEDRREAAPFDMPVLAFDAMLGRNRVPINGLLFRASAVAAAGAFDARLPVLEDWDFLLRVMALGDIGVLPRALAYYHHRDADALPAYLNSAHEAPSAHEIQFQRYQNHRLRALANADPGALSVVGTLGLQAERYHEQAELQHRTILANLDRNGLWGHARHEDLQQRLIRVEQMLARLEARLDARLEAPLGPEPAPEPPPPTVIAARPLWKRAARRLAGPLIDRVRQRSA